MRVLLVAPRTDLPLVDSEIQDVIRSGLEVTPLLGSVSSTDLLREIRAADYDCLWLATHGGPDGVQLSDGMMAASELVAVIRDRFKLVFLNTCNSLLVAQLLQEEANASVICTLIGVPDRQAYQTGSLFATALSDTGNIAAAYKRSKPGGNRSYLYLAALDPSQDSINTLVMEFRNFKTEVEQSAANAVETIHLLQRLLYISLALHVPEWIALVWLFSMVVHGQ